MRIGGIMSEERNVLVVTSSPRAGSNSTELALRLARGCREAGAEVDTVDIGRLPVGPCKACDWCHQHAGSGCTLKDGMQEVYPKIRKADTLVLATPIYCFTMSAQLKIFLDRLYALMAEAELPGGYSFQGRKLALCITYGDCDVFQSGGINAIRAVQDLCKYLGVEYVGAVYGTANAAGEIVSNGALLEEAFTFGKSLVQRS